MELLEHSLIEAWIDQRKRQGVPFSDEEIEHRFEKDANGNWRMRRGLDSPLDSTSDGISGSREVVSED